MVFLYVLAGLLGAAAMIFALQNPEPVAVVFLNWQSAGMPLSLLLLLAMFVGVVFASLSGFTQQLALKRRIRHLERRITEISAPVERPARGEAARVDPAVRKA